MRAPANARVAEIVRRIEAGTLKPDAANMAKARISTSHDGLNGEAYERAPSRMRAKTG